jgi:hypothetical protein
VNFANAACTIGFSGQASDRIKTVPALQREACSSKFQSQLLSFPQFATDWFSWSDGVLPAPAFQAGLILHEQSAICQA